MQFRCSSRIRSVVQIGREHTMHLEALQLPIVCICQEYYNKFGGGACRNPAIALSWYCTVLSSLRKSMYEYKYWRTARQRVIVTTRFVCIPITNGHLAGFPTVHRRSLSRYLFLSPVRRRNHAVAAGLDRASLLNMLVCKTQSVSEACIFGFFFLLRHWNNRH